MSNKKLTTGNGNPMSDNQNSLTAGVNGPILIQDFSYIDKIAHFDRERIPERVVHAKGAGAHGYFEVTNPNLSKYSKAKFLNRKGKRTPLLTRFSTVGGEKGSADTARDPRGFAVKMYTEEGNMDLVGNNTPVFFIRDPIKFPDFIHTQKRNPQTNLPDPNMVWDFFSFHPEATHQFTILFSDRGTPDGYRHMNGYSSHTLKHVNANGEQFWVKWHFKTDSGIKNLTAEKAEELAGKDPNYATRDLFNHIDKGGVASWTVYWQVMKYEDGFTYKVNPFDVTKVWSHKDYPLMEVGKMVLDRNPTNFFAEIEQAAFSPSHMVPGIEPSPDKMLQGRLFSYPDTHRHRLGPNYLQIPVNRPYRAKIFNQQRDGLMTVTNNGGSAPNYEPNSFDKPQETPKALIAPFKVSGTASRTKPIVRQVNDFEQAGDLFRNVMNEQERSRLIQNIAGHMSGANVEIQKRSVALFAKCDKDYGERLAKALGLKSNM